MLLCQQILDLRDYWVQAWEGRILPKPVLGDWGRVALVCAVSSISFEQSISFQIIVGSLNFQRISFPDVLESFCKLYDAKYI